MQVANTSDEMFEKMGTGDFDVVSASGDSSLRMIYAGKVAPVNTTLLTNYADIAPFQKGQQWNSVDGVDYGIPHGWGANLLSWRTDKVNAGARLVERGVRRDSPYKGKIGAYDSPTYLADAALYLMAPSPTSGSRTRTRSTRRSSTPAVALATEQKSILAGYWSAYADAQKAFTNGTYVLGTSWQIIVTWRRATRRRSTRSCRRRAPPAGRTPGWSTRSRRTRTARTMWMNWITTPKVQAAGRGVVR